MAMFKITGYHGTDRSVANDILRSGFRCKNNKEHWLGDGIYFYTDKALAEWWTKNPTKKHGMDIREPVIMECRIEVEEDKALNLCSLKGYEEYITLFNRFLLQWTRKIKEYKDVNCKQLRCAFFNYLLLLYEVDVIVAPFVLPDQPYMPQYFNAQYATEMHIQYTEVQICVAEARQNMIKDTVVHIL